MKLINLFLYTLLIHLQTIEIQAPIEETASNNELVNKYKENETLRQEHSKIRHFLNAQMFDFRQLQKNYNEYKTANNAQKQLDYQEIQRLRNKEEERTQILKEQHKWYSPFQSRAYNIAKQAENSLNLANMSQAKLEEVLENSYITDNLKMQEVEQLNPKNLAEVLLKKKFMQKLQEKIDWIQGEEPSSTTKGYKFQIIPDSFVYALTQKQIQEIINFNEENPQSSNFKNIFSDEQQKYLKEFAASAQSDPIRSIRDAVNAQELNTNQQKAFKAYLEKISTANKQSLIKVFMKNIENIKLDLNEKIDRIKNFKKVIQESMQPYEWIINLKSESKPNEFQIVDMGNIKPIPSSNNDPDFLFFLDQKYKQLLNNNVFTISDYSYQDFQKAYADWVLAEINLNESLMDNLFTSKKSGISTSKSNYILNITSLINDVLNNKPFENKTDRTILKTIQEKLSTEINNFVQKNSIEKLNVDYIPYINTNFLQKLDLTDLSLSQIQDLSAEQIQALSAEQIQALSADQIQVLSPEQIQALSPEQIQVLSPEQIQVLFPEQLKNIDLNKFSDSQITILKLKLSKLSKFDLELIKTNRNIPQELKEFIENIIKNIIQKEKVPDKPVATKQSAQEAINEEQQLIKNLTNQELEKLNINEVKKYKLEYFSTDQIKYILTNNKDAQTLVYILENRNDLDEDTYQIDAIDKALDVIVQDPKGIESLEETKNSLLEISIQHYLSLKLEKIYNNLSEKLSDHYSLYSNKLKDKITELQNSLNNLHEDVLFNKYSQAAKTITNSKEIMENIIKEITAEEQEIQKNKDASSQPSQQQEVTFLKAIKRQLKETINNLTPLQKAELGFMWATAVSTSTASDSMSSSLGSITSTATSAINTALKTTSNIASNISERTKAASEDISSIVSSVGELIKSKIPGYQASFSSQAGYIIPKGPNMFGNQPGSLALLATKPSDQN